MKKKQKTKAKVELFCYTDESGNTGSEIFDCAQPYFWTGTLVSPVDLEKVGAEALEEWTAIVGEAELHANHLGVGRIETIAGSIEKFLTDHKCVFIFTRVEKRHMAGTKLVDTLLGVNPIPS